MSAPARPAVVTTAAQITPEWLTAMWRSQGHDVAVAAVRNAPIGTGQSAHSERITIDYAHHDGRVPHSLVAKLPHPDPTSRATGHVHGSYAREVGFYREIAPTVRIRTPHCWYVDIDRANSDFVLLLEDMAPATQGDQMRGCSVAVARSAMREVAGLHAPRWADAKLSAHSFLAGAMRNDEAAALGGQFFDACWQGFLARYREQLAPDILRVGEGLHRHYANYISVYEGPRCATHGDYRLDNVLLREDAPHERIAVVDWQTAGVGAGASDVAYFLGAGLLPEDRRRHEQDLLREYHDALTAGGVRDYPFARLERDYARYAYAGYVMAIVASMLVVQTARGDEMFMVMAHRHGQQVIDLDAEREIAE